MNTTYAIWVKARYTGERAKSIFAHANAGIGYVVLDKPDKGESWVVAAFRRPSGLISHGLEEITDRKLIERLEERTLPPHLRKKPTSP